MKIPRLLKNWYHRIRGFAEKYLIGSTFQKIAWSKRHVYEGTQWIEDHWNRGNDPWAQKQVHYYGTVLKKHFFPFQTALDYGCLSGVNCHLLSQQFPSVTWHGVDVNEAAIAFGREKLKAIRNKRVYLSTSTGETLSQLKEKSIDVIFTSAVLFYLAPDTLQWVIKDMMRVARKGIIFFELQSPHNPGDPLGKGIYEGGHWMRNYKDALIACGLPKENISEEKIPENHWGGWPEKAYATIAEL